MGLCVEVVWGLGWAVISFPILSALRNGAECVVACVP